MAAKKSHRYLIGTYNLNPDDGHTAAFEFDESEVWAPANDNIVSQSETRIRANPRPLRVRKAGSGQAVGPRSLPVNIPDWSKILRGAYSPRAVEVADDDDDDVEDGGNDKIPPHEYLARTRAASLSVHEGVGRTLKGRDLSRVRNAIWEKIGFED